MVPIRGSISGRCDTSIQGTRETKSIQLKFPCPPHGHPNFWGPSFKMPIWGQSTTCVESHTKGRSSRMTSQRCSRSSRTRQWARPTGWGRGKAGSKIPGTSSSRNGRYIYSWSFINIKSDINNIFNVTISSATGRTSSTEGGTTCGPVYFLHFISCYLSIQNIMQLEQIEEHPDNYEEAKSILARDWQGMKKFVMRRNKISKDQFDKEELKVVLSRWAIFYSTKNFLAKIKNYIFSKHFYNVIFLLMSGFWATDCDLVGYKEPEDKLCGEQDKKGGHATAKFMDDDDNDDDAEGGAQAGLGDDSDGYWRRKRRHHPNIKTVFSQKILLCYYHERIFLTLRTIQSLIFRH